LAPQPRRRQEVHQAHRTLVGDRVEKDEGLLARPCLDVLEKLFLGVVEKLSGLGPRGVDSLGHGAAPPSSLVGEASLAPTTPASGQTAGPRGGERSAQRRR